MNKAVAKTEKRHGNKVFVAPVRCFLLKKSKEKKKLKKVQVTSKQVEA